MKLSLYIIRGLPGSGKSTLAHSLVGDGNYFEADMFFTDPKTGEYRFDHTRLPAAHAWCWDRVQKAMRSRYDILRDNNPWDPSAPEIVTRGIIDYTSVAVSNTFSQAWEVEPYIALCNLAEFKDHWSVNLIEMKNSFGSTHGVPEESIQKMRGRWENLVNTHQSDDSRKVCAL
jgi:hypothetical protein